MVYCVLVLPTMAKRGLVAVHLWLAEEDGLSSAATVYSDAG
jgi:hypothetical protein